MKSDLLVAIEILYITFSKYTTDGIHHCQCGCINENDVKKLHSKSLKELEPDNLISYHGSAIFTWGEVSHYKHFLPRICELISTRNPHFNVLTDLLSRLEYASWTSWPEEEKNAITKYITEEWKNFANDCNSEISITDVETYSAFLGLTKALQLWQVSKSPESFRNMVEFFYHYGHSILNGKKQYPEFLDWITNENITELMEKKYFELENSNQEFADRISIVLHLIENN